MKKQIDQARCLVLELMQDVLTQGKYANESLQERLSEFAGNARDCAFISASLYGVLSRLTALDYEIGVVSKIGLEKLEPVVLNILRYGLWQLRYAYAVPAHAALDESVTLARSLSGEAAAKYVNALLRRLSIEKIVFPKKLKGVELGLGTELYGLFRKWYGDRVAEDLAKGFLEDRPWTTFRPNRARSSVLKLLADPEIKEREGRASALWSEAFELKLKGKSVLDLQAYRAGLCSVQDLAAQLVAHFAVQEPFTRVLDLCAAPGGKILDLMERSPEAAYFAMDLVPERLARVESARKRLGLMTDCQMAVADASDPALADVRRRLTWPDQYDLVLCDVPCSGLGLLGRKVEIRFKSSYQALQAFPEQQMAILRAAAAACGPGGQVLYSTCTLNPAENKELVQQFLASDEGQAFKLKPFGACLPPALIQRISQDPLCLADLQAGFLTLRPDLLPCDGFFISRLERQR